MANHKSALKRARQTAVRTARNKAVRTRARHAVRRVRQAIAAGDLATAQRQLREAQHVLDRAARKGVIHANAAARRKSRLAAAVNRLAREAEAPASTSAAS